MSKALNDERRIDALRREFVKIKPGLDAPFPTPVLAPPESAAPPVPLASAELPAAAVATAVLERPAELDAVPPVPVSAAPTDRDTPAISPDVVRHAHRWYSTLTFCIAFGVTLGIVTIARTSLQRAGMAARVPRPIPPTAPPASPVSAVPNVSVAPPPPPHPQRSRDPFAEALSPDPDDAALAEAARVYRLMEAVLRDATSTVPVPPSDPSTPAEAPDVPEHR